MRDFTSGSIRSHLVASAVPIAIGTALQMVNYLVDLYLIAQLDNAALAGASAAVTLAVFVVGLTQGLSVSTTSLISHAAGRKDFAAASATFQQALLVAAILGFGIVIAGYAVGPLYLAWVGADAATRAASELYLFFLIPGLGLQFIVAAMSGGLRAVGAIKAVTYVSSIAVILKIALSPVLVLGFGDWSGFGVAGAGFIGTFGAAIMVALLVWQLRKVRSALWSHGERVAVRLASCKGLVQIGAPATVDYALTFVFTSVLYWASGQFGVDDQAGFGIGLRIMQAIMLLPQAVSFAAAAVAGQNFGAGQSHQVRAAYSEALRINSWLLGVLTVLCWASPRWLVGLFSDDAVVMSRAADFLVVASCTFVFQGIALSASGLFRALGNTVPSVLTSSGKLLVFALPVAWLWFMGALQLTSLWVIFVGANIVQAVLSLWLVRQQLLARLPPMQLATQGTVQ
jgi:putative MATE family efflux protein